jgi:hypothetical protein
VVAFVIWIILALASAFAQVSAKQEPPSTDTPDEADEITVDGCLYGGQGNFELVNADDAFTLRGDLSALKKYVGDEVKVRGKQEGSNRPLSLVVSAVTLVFKAPQVRLSKTITDPTNWIFQTNESYGVKFALPALPKNSVGGGSVFPNFASETGTITLASVPIPEEIYAGSGFAGGNYLLSANSEINNRESCEKFGASDPRFLSYSTANGTRYTKLTVGDAAMGTSYEELYFHTFQNDMCYEIAFSFGEVNTANQDFGCRVPRHGVTDEVLEEFMKRISYLPPKVVSSPKPSNAVPKVTSFTVSSAIVNGVNDRGVAEFTWTTQGADYVELSYRCSTFGLGVVIAEQGGAGGQNCENDPKPIIPQTQQLNHPPNSELEVSLANFHHDDPISIVVTITPFSHGVAYPTGRKSITIRVAPYNPFPKGIPSSTANITLTYSGGPKDSYQQGASLTLTWTDTLSPDPCVNLLLARDTGRGLQYVGRVSQQCLRPAAAGTYTWTIPGRYSGSGFRVYAAAPGQRSSGLGPVFSIVKTGPQDRQKQ